MIYVSTACIKKEKVADIIKEYVKNGIRNIELSGGTKYYEALVDDLYDLKEKYHLNYAFHAYFPPPKKDFVINLASCNNEVYTKSIDHYMLCIDMMKRINCKILSVHAGFLLEINSDEIGKELKSTIIYEKEEALERFCAAYEKIKKECEKNEIQLYLENNVLSTANYKNFEKSNLLLLTNYRAFVELAQMLNFELLLDLGHLYVSATALNLNFEKECQLFAPYVKWLHISQNNGIEDQHKPLDREQPIVKAYKKIFNQKVNVSLETVGNIGEILRSIDVIQ